MKLLFVILCLPLCLAIAHAQETSRASNGLMSSADQRAAAKLQLLTSISEQRYSVEAGSKLLRLKLNLNYLNTGERPILLDKKSSLIYRRLLSRNLRALSKGEYVYDGSSSFIDVRSMQATGMRLEGAPEKETFITLKPGESFRLKGEILLRLYDGTKDTDDFLHPGTYFLQLRVATWYYFADPEEYREKWLAEGDLWSQNITSEPMSLTIEKAR